MKVQIQIPLLLPPNTFSLFSRLIVSMDDEAIAYFLIIAIGIGYLFPFSALTQPIDYWHVLFPTRNIEFPMTTVFMWVNLTFLGLIVFFRQKSSITFRIVGGFIGQLVILLLVPNLTFFNLTEDTHYLMIMILTSIAAAATSLIDSVAIGLASQYSPKVLEGLQLGIGLSTLIGSVYRVLTKILFSSSQIIQSSILYFYVGGLTIFCCILSYYYLLSLPISAQIQSMHGDKAQSKTTTTTTDEEHIQLLDKTKKTANHNYSSLADKQGDQVLLEEGESESTNTKKAKILLSDHHHHHHQADEENGVSISSNAAIIPIHGDDEKAVSDYSNKITWEEKMRVLNKVIYQEFLVFAVYFTSLLLWPAMCTEIKSYSFPSLNDETKWWALILLLSFSVLDCVGRLLTSHRMGLTKDNIGIVVLLRFALIPVIYYIARDQFPIRSDLLSLSLVSILGFTNGYIGSLNIIMVTENVTELHEKEIAGGFTGFFLNVGLVFGSTAALLFQS